MFARRRIPLLKFLGITVLLIGLSLSVAAVNPETEEMTLLTFERDDDGQFVELDQETCLVPCEEIVSGGPPPDGIPSIDDPKFISVSEAESDMDADDIVLGVEINGEMRAYPYKILNWHEIVNIDRYGNARSITYCPLTGTGILFHTATIDNAEVGTSGKLYENNLVFYDRVSDTQWSQMYGLAIKGSKIGQTLDMGITIETTWKAIKTMYPDAQVLSRDTGIYPEDRYDGYPYERYNYLESRTILFDTAYNPSEYPDSLYHPKSLTTVILGEAPVLFPFSTLDTTRAASIELDDTKISIFFDEDARLSVPFNASYDGTELSFTRIESSSYSSELTFDLEIYKDQFGNVWNMKGVAIDGSAKGQNLTRIPSYNAFWFAAVAFFPDAMLHHLTEVTSEDTTVFSGTLETLTGDNKTGEFTEDNSLSANFIGLAVLLVVPVLIKRRRP